MNSHVSALDRAADRRNDLDFLEARLGDPNTLLLPLWRGQPFVQRDALHLVRVSEVGELIERSSEIVWLGFFEDQACFALDISVLAEPLRHAALSGSEPKELRVILSQLPKPASALVMYARALLNWHERHQFCAKCGNETRPRQGGHTRVCAHGLRYRTFSAYRSCVLVLVRDGDRCLLGRSRGWPAGMFSALAGFVEPGETLEQAAAREVLEEVGVTISDLQYFGSEPWPFPASLMIGFVANLTGGEVRVDGVELEAARWVSRDELSAAAGSDFFVPPATVSLSGRLIAAFAARQI